MQPQGGAVRVIPNKLYIESTRGCKLYIESKPSSTKLSNQISSIQPSPHRQAGITDGAI
jgi:hypothetical protein